MATNLLKKLIGGFKLSVYIFVLSTFLFYCGLLPGKGNNETTIFIPQSYDSSNRISPMLRSHDGDVSYVGESGNDLKVIPRSELYDVTMGSTGPILHDSHLVKKSKQKSKCRVYPNTSSLKLNAQVGQLFSLTIEIDKDVLIQKTILSVLAVGENHIFAANHLNFSVDGSLMTFTYTPKVPGLYNLFVEEINANAQLQIPGSPFRLVVEGDPVYAVQLGRNADKLPSCQTMQLTRPSWLDGEWITGNIAGLKRGVLRSGWVFQPDWCSFDIFTTKDLAMAAEMTSPKKIAVLGSSIERGIFFSLVDLLLAKEEKYNLTKSDFRECWGHAHVEVGNLTLLYQDFRIVTVGNLKMGEDGKAEIICHDEKIAKSGDYDYFDDGIRFLSEYLFAQSHDKWPNIIVIPIRETNHLELLLKAIPPSWSGTIYTLYNFVVIRTNLYTKDGLAKSYKLAKNLLSVDSRIQLIDGFGLISAMRHNTQSAPLIKSGHTHRWCNELNGEMTVCGNPTEMIAQMLLGKVIAPEGKDAWLKAITSKPKIMFPRQLKICQDCPASLLPFHIKPIPDLTCYVSESVRETSSDKQEVWDGSLCPAECLKLKPVGTEQTQSGSVSVRSCNVKLF
ncbi:uncharacterized protein [Apostichopus japonicus]|uniref:uncharacterized protein isoform X1 n=2 Tax=Stichopus japonicus TaxID=307972 RepID=UPI003AB5ACE6